MTRPARKPHRKTEASDYRHIEQCYDEGSDDYSGHFREPHDFIDPKKREFVRQLPIGSHILDCGCGPGMDTEKFFHLGYHLTAIDLSERFVRRTQTRVPGAIVRKMDMRFLDFPEATFDGLWASFSLLHIRATDVDETLSGFRRVLRPAGLFFTAVHRGRSTQWVKTTISGMERDTYVQEWSQTDIENRITFAGFTILQTRPFIRTGGRYPLLSILAQS